MVEIHLEVVDVDLAFKPAWSKKSTVEHRGGLGCVSCVCVENNTSQARKTRQYGMHTAQVKTRTWGFVVKGIV